MRGIEKLIIGLFLLQGCSEQNSAPGELANNVVSDASGDDASEFPEFQHGEPTGEGMELANAGMKSLSTTPAITVSDSWVGQDNADMAALVQEAVSIMTDAQWRSYGTMLKADYPRAWFATDYGDAEQVTATVGGPASPLRYLPASVVPFKGWAQTGGREGRVFISVSPDLLLRWRSPDVVMRSCAVNTMAHEISHTLSRSSTRYLYAFTDTGVGREARRKPPASYLTGNIALCSYLIRQGRIQPARLKQCVAAWYHPDGFRSGRCDDFPGNTPIE